MKTAIDNLISYLTGYAMANDKIPVELVIGRAKEYKLAEESNVKNIYSKHDVIKSVCECSEHDNEQTGGGEYCGHCGKPRH